MMPGFSRKCGGLAKSAKIVTIFAVLMTIWLARPVKFTPALKFVLVSIFGFIMGGAAGLIQANIGLNVVFHNTQWVVALHAHTFLLTGLGIGAALGGMRPGVELMFMDFVLGAADQSVNQAAKRRYMSGGQARIPVVFRTQEGAGRSSAVLFLLMPLSAIGVITVILRNIF